MLHENRRPDVAVFIDFENVYVSVRDKLDANPNFESIMERCNELGRVVIARAYADWYRYPRVTSALYANGIEPMYVPTYYYDKDMGRTGRAIKNSVDMNLCIDAMKTLFVHTNIDRFVLVTGDRDFIPLVNSIRQQGKEVIIIGIGGAASTHLAQSADEFVFYEQLVGKGPQSVVSDRQRARSSDVAANDVAEGSGAPAESDIYGVLIDAIYLVRKRGYVSTLGSLKLVMKELMGGDFKESRYRDLNGRPFAKFKDFVLDAEKRGKVQIFTNGTVNEVFLPNEDPYKLSQFAADLKEEPLEPGLDMALLGNGRQDRKPAATEAEILQPAPTPTGRRRRRRSRSQRRNAETAAETPAQPPLLDGVQPDPSVADSPDELRDLDGLELIAEIAAFQEEMTPEEVIAAEAGDALFDDKEQLPEQAISKLPSETGAPDAELVAAPEPLGTELEPRSLAEQEAAPALEDETPGSSDTVEYVPEPEIIFTPEMSNFVAYEVEPALVADEGAALTESEMAPAAEEMPVAETPVVEDQALVSEEIAPEPVAVSLPEAVETVVELTAEKAGEGEEEESDIDYIAFSDEEWQVFRTMMAGFTKPASFAQVFDTLRELRKQEAISRTNEQLRTMVKQAINAGLLERSGRGKRIYYKLKSEG
ncbi:MAG: NYN domain-containing protein [Chloroflexales bacterium]|nr:NYN domain-containing protein [Chloroflexales bacterium]